LVRVEVKEAEKLRRFPVQFVEEVVEVVRLYVPLQY
jgi:hypothetical protein